MLFAFAGLNAAAGFPSEVKSPAKAKLPPPRILRLKQ